MISRRQMTILVPVLLAAVVVLVPPSARANNIAPTTTAAASPGPNADGWNNGDVTVSLTAADDAGGSGVKEISYSLNGSAPTIVSGASASITVSQEGTTTLTYFATDNVGNQESPKTLTIKMDKTAPSSQVLPFPANEAFSSVTVQWTGADAGSGIKDFTIYVSDNGGPFTIWQQNIISTSAVFVGQPGHTYSFYSIARDVAGNVEAAKSAGDQSITFLYEAPGHPADTNNDWRLSINEITAYGAAWKRGDPWQSGPNPIPIDYVTNAGALWKTGEQYQYDSTKNPPLCWIGAAE